MFVAVFASLEEVLDGATMGRGADKSTFRDKRRGAPPIPSDCTTVTPNQSRFPHLENGQKPRLSIPQGCCEGYTALPAEPSVWPALGKWQPSLPPSSPAEGVRKPPTSSERGPRYRMLFSDTRLDPPVATGVAGAAWGTRHSDNSSHRALTACQAWLAGLPQVFIRETEAQSDRITLSRPYVW